MSYPLYDQLVSLSAIPSTTLRPTQKARLVEGMQKLDDDGKVAFYSLVLHHYKKTTTESQPDPTKPPFGLSLEKTDKPGIVHVTGTIEALPKDLQHVLLRFIEKKNKL